MGEWYHNEDGGYYCSVCGCFHDDYYDTELLCKCPKCGASLKDSDKSVDREYRLSIGAKFCEDEEYPKWLLDLRSKKALEKQIPKKVNISLRGTTDLNTRCHCPSCRAYVFNDRYCRNCGQALDWSGTK